MAFLDRIAECNSHDRSGYTPWLVEDRHLGWLRGDRCEAVLGPGSPFEVSESGLVLRGRDPAERSAALTGLFDGLVGRGLAPPARGELYPVSARVRAAPDCIVDRAHVAWLGVRASGVHVNGFVRTPTGIAMWIAERSRSKITFPGMLDNMVAGGQPHGLGLRENVVKECAEEAGIPAALARTAVPVGAVSYEYEDDTGIKPDTMFCFDLELPADFQPLCTDGEVERFELLPIGEVAALVRDTRRFKFNCNLVVIDFLVRTGWLDVDDPDYADVVEGLRRGAVVRSIR